MPNLENDIKSPEDRNKDIPTLSNWIKTAVRCSSIDEFIELIR